MKKIYLSICFVFILFFVSACSEQSSSLYEKEEIQEQPEMDRPTRNANSVNEKQEEAEESKDNNAVVYMTTDISSKGVLHIYDVLERKAEGENVAVKISTREPLRMISSSQWRRRPVSLQTIMVIIYFTSVS